MLTDETAAISASKNGLFNAIYWSYVACTESELMKIMQRVVFCAHKPYFLMPGHICQ